MKRACVQIVALCCCLLASITGVGNAQGGRQSSRDTLALVGSVPVTAQDLRQRLELMPWHGMELASRIDSIKVHALQGLVAERLLALEAHRIHLADDETTKRMRRGLESLFLRDELYRREVMERSRPTPEDVDRGLQRFAKQVTVRALGAKSESDAAALYKRLEGARSIDSVISILPEGFLASNDTVVVNFGGLDPVFENAAYGLGPRRVSRPVGSPVYGWVVLWLMQSETNPTAAAMNIPDRMSRVQRVIQERKETERAEKFYYNILQDQAVTADGEALLRIAREVRAIWDEDTMVARSRNGYIVGSGMIDELVERLSSIGDRAYATLRDGPLTVNDAVEMLRYQSLEVPSRDTLVVAQALNGTLRDVVAGEILAREARKRNLQFTPRVERDMTMWTSYWAARSLFYAVRESVSVSEEEVAAFLRKNAAVFGRMYEVNVREVLVPSLADAEHVLSRIRTSERMEVVAREMSRRTEWGVRGGESGFFPVAEHPDLGFRALGAPVGILQGPYHLAEGYSLFTVLGKRKTSETSAAFDTLQMNIRARLRAEAANNRTNRLLASLARAYRVQFRLDKLSSVPITTTNMFTRRNIGFGGSMIAIPVLMPQWEWAKEFEKETPDLP